MLRDMARILILLYQHVLLHYNGILLNSFNMFFFTESDSKKGCGMDGGDFFVVGQSIYQQV